MRMEVRCCCQPQKLLGTVEVPSYTEPDMSVTWPLRSIIDVHAWDTGDKDSKPEEKLTLQCKLYRPMYSKGWPAIKAEGVTLDILRRVPTFEEAPGWHNLPKELTIIDEFTPFPEYRR